MLLSTDINANNTISHALHCRYTRDIPTFVRLPALFPLVEAILRNLKIEQLPKLHRMAMCIFHSYYTACNCCINTKRCLQISNKWIKIVPSSVCNCLFVQNVKCYFSQFPSGKMALDSVTEKIMIDDLVIFSQEKKAVNKYST